MQILFHIGAHATDNGLLIRSILRNRGVLAEEGIIIPGPSRYRELIGDVSMTLRGEAASEDTEDMLLEAIGDNAAAERIILSNENFLCPDDAAVSADGLYGMAHQSAWLRSCFPSHDVEFALALKNPATLVPDLLSRLDDGARTALMPALQSDDFRWVDVLVDLTEANPDTPITVWCHEETPYIWGDLLRELTAHDPATVLDGETDMLEQIMSPEGVSKLADFLEAHPGADRTQRNRAITAFLQAHAGDELETEIDLPGWSADTVADLTATYDADTATIGAMTNVTLVRA